MTDTFSEVRYRAERGSLLESLTDSVESLKKLSEDRRQAKAAPPSSNPIVSAADALKQETKDAYTSLKEQTLRAAESPVGSNPQLKPATIPIAKPVPVDTPSLMPGHKWTSAGGWESKGPDQF